MSDRVQQAANRAELRRRIQARAHFDYRDPYSGECGCVAPTMDVMAGRHRLQSFGFSQAENAYVIGCDVREVGTGKHYIDMTRREATGEAGKAEALRRLDVVARRIWIRQWAESQGSTS